MNPAEHRACCDSMCLSPMKPAGEQRDAGPWVRGPFLSNVCPRPCVQEAEETHCTAQCFGGKLYL